MPFLFGGSSNDGFYKRVIIVLLLIHVVVGSLALAWALRVLLIDVLLAVTVASAIAPLAEQLEQKKIPRALTVALTYLTVIGFYAGVAFMIAQPFREQAKLFSAQLPKYTQEVKQGYDELLDYLGESPLINTLQEFNEPAPGGDTAGSAAPAKTEATGSSGTVIVSPDKANGSDESDVAAAVDPTAPLISVTVSPDKAKAGGTGKPHTVQASANSMIKVKADDLRGPLLKLVSQTLEVTAGLMGLVLNGVLVLFLGAYFVIEADHIWTNLLLWIPAANRERARSLIRPLGARMGGYIRGQILVSTAVATFFAVGLTIIQVKYGLVLGLLAGILNLLPFVGSMLVTVLACFVAANQGLLPLGLTIGLFALEQTVESNFIVPHLLGKQVDLHPLIVLFSILIGANLAGAVGALAAVPLAAAILYLAQEFYLRPLNAVAPSELPAAPSNPPPTPQLDPPSHEHSD